MRDDGEFYGHEYIVTEVVFHNHCPLCGYQTDEHYTRKRWYIHESLHFKKELNDKEPFELIEIEADNYIVCPNCGVVLSCKACQSESEYKP